MTEECIYFCVSAWWCIRDFTAREISILNLHVSESEEMKGHGCFVKGHGCFVLGLMKYNICKISFGECAQTISQRRNCFLRGLRGVLEKEQRIFTRVPWAQPGQWRQWTVTGFPHSHWGPLEYSSTFQQVIWLGLRSKMELNHMMVWSKMFFWFGTFWKSRFMSGLNLFNRVKKGKNPSCYIPGSNWKLILALGLSLNK